MFGFFSSKNDFPSFFQSTIFGCCCDSTIAIKEVKAETAPVRVDSFIACCRVGEYIPPFDVFPEENYHRTCAVASTAAVAKQNVPNICKSAATRRSQSDPAWPIHCDNALRTMWAFWTDVVCVQTSNVADYNSNYTSLYYDSVSSSSATSSTTDGFGTRAADELYIHTDSYHNQHAYKSGEPMLAVYNSLVSGASPTTFKNFFLPSADFGGSCDGETSIKFLEDVRESKCQIHTSNFETACAANGALDVTTYISNIWVSKQSNGTTLPPSDDSEWSNVIYRLAKNPSSSTFVTQVASSGTVNTGLTTPWYSSYTGICYNAVQEVQYDVEYDASTGLVTSINASATVGDVTGAGRVSVDASFGVSFYKYGATLATGAVKSGVPGYVPGSMLLAGYTSTYGSQSAISQSVTGATVVTPGLNGACSTTEKTPILFKTDMKVQCTVSLTESELQTYCETGNIPSFLSLNYTEIGKFGGSSLYYTGNWTTITYSGSTPTATWDAATRTCSSLVYGLKYTILHGAFGQAEVAQDGISGVQVSFLTESWQYPSTATGSVSFTHEVIVEYVDIGNSLSERYPEFAPVIRGVPDDIFHPFYPFVDVNAAT